MKSQNKFLLTSVTLAVLTLINQAHAADAAPAATADSAAPAKDPVAAEMQQVVVTGVASGGAVRKVDSPYSITTANAEQLKEAVPTSTADLMKISPGVYVESTGGQTGANIQIRGFPSGGDAPYVTLQLNGSPLFPAPTLSFLANDSTFRIDDTIERAEILRGGPSVILSNGQPGATMNFILKKGDDVPEGTLRATVGTGRMMRYDAFFSGKLSDGWYGSIGGFYRTDNGVRNPGFPADDGGSLTATVTHRLQDGEMTFYLRSLSDKNAFYTAVPVLLSPSGTLSAYPGVNPLTWTPMSNQTRLFTLPDGTKGDLADGRGASNNTFGFDFDQKVNGWDVNNKLIYFKGDQNTIAMFSGPPPQTLGAQDASFIAAANGNAALVSAAGGMATSAIGTYVDGSGTVNANTQTIEEGLWVVKKKLQNFTDELRFTKEIVPNHNLTVGAYASHYSSNDVWDLGNSMLLDLNGKPIQVTLNNGALATNAQGFASGCTFCIAEDGTTDNRALYLADEWKVSSSVKLDAGVRHETQDMSLAFQSPNTAAAPANPLAAYAYGMSQANGPVIAYNPSWSLNSYTVGGLYSIEKNTNVYVRYNAGGQFPFFDQVRGSTVSAPPPVTKIKQLETGFKTVGKLYSATVAIFANRFEDQFQSVSTFAGLPVNTVGGSRTYGVEYELSVRPLPGLQIALSGDAQHAKYQDYNDALSPGINGMVVQRQPDSQWRLTPTYSLPVGDNTLKLYATYSHINARYDDQQNAEFLPSYNTLDAGVLFEVGEKLEFRLSGSNLTNELGLTEGSAGREVSVGGSVPYATVGRPLFGRALEFSVAYHF